MSDPFMDVANDIFRRIHRGAITYTRDIQAIETHITLAKQLGKDEVRVRLTNLAGILCFEVGKLSLALEYIQQAYDLAMYFGWELHVANAESNFASVAVLRADYTSAEQYLRQACQRPVPSPLIIHMSELAYVLMLQNKMDAAHSFVTTAFEYIGNDIWDYKLPLIDLWHCKSELYLSHQNYTEAWHAIHKAEQLAQDLHNQIKMSDLFFGMSHIARLDQSHTESPEVYRSLLMNAYTQGDQNPLLLARAYFREAQYQYHREHHNLTQDFAHTALKFFQKTSAQDEIIMAEQFLSTYSQT